jgi:transcriptional regulator with XRE-family HTH domain
MALLLREAIGAGLRRARTARRRTLRDVSRRARVSLGYLSEVERGRKEPSSELLAAICEALGARLSEVLGEVSDTLALAEGMQGVLVPVEDGAKPIAAPAVPAKSAEASVRKVTANGNVSVSVRHDNALKATLRTTRKRDRDVVYAA